MKYVCLVFVKSFIIQLFITAGPCSQASDGKVVKVNLHAKSVCFSLNKQNL